MAVDVLKSVIFIGFLNIITGKFEARGTAFIVQTEEKFDSVGIKKVAICTARHIIDALEQKSVDQIVVRFNSENGVSFLRTTRIQDWIKSPDPRTDLAIYIAAFPARTEHSAIPISMFNTLGNASIFDIRLGDTVCFPGLFYPHVGQAVMTPILRSGFVSRLADNEGVSAISPNGEKLEGITAHLIEARSIGGFSGSPVFYIADGLDLLTKRINGTGPHKFLIGLVSGHFPISESSTNSIGNDILEPRFLNSGITYVTPSDSIHQLIIDTAQQDSKERLFYPIETAQVSSELLNKLNNAGYTAIRHLAESPERFRQVQHQFMQLGSILENIFANKDDLESEPSDKYRSSLLELFLDEHFKIVGKFTYGDEKFEEMHRELERSIENFLETFIELHGKNLSKLDQLFS